MRLMAAAELKAGGQGSGCDPEIAREHGKTCGRPSKGAVVDKGGLLRHPTRNFVDDPKINRIINKRARKRAAALDSAGYELMGVFGNMTAKPLGSEAVPPNTPMRHLHLKYKKGPHRVAIKLSRSAGWKSWRFNEHGQVKHVRQSSRTAGLWRDDSAQARALKRHITRVEHKYKAA